jgi:hypothetical protein
MTYRFEMTDDELHEKCLASGMTESEAFLVVLMDRAEAFYHQHLGDQEMAMSCTTLSILTPRPWHSSRYENVEHK